MCVCVCACVCVHTPSYVWLSVAPRTVASSSSVHGISEARILKWSGLPFSSPEDLPDPSLLSLLHWQADSLPLTPRGKPRRV